MTRPAPDAAPTPAKPPVDHDVILAGEYVLGLLSPIDAASFVHRLAVDGTLATKHAEWVNAFLPLTMGRDVAPPPTLFKSIEERVFPAEEPPAKPARAWIGRVVLLVVPTAAFFIAALILQR